MKKSLVALAVLAAAGAASAQSSVTLWGIVDANVGYGSANSVKKTQLMNSSNASSRLGFRGVEDLGGGMQAGFWLESALNNDNGTSGATSTNNQASGAVANGGGLTFGRRATVSVGGGFGEVRLGRDYTPHFWNHTVYDPFGTNGVGSSVTVGSLAGATAVRASNSVAYLYNPGSFNGNSLIGKGLGVFLQTYMGENASNAANSKDGGGYSARVSYDQGPLSAAVAYGRTNMLNADVTTANVGASYDLGVAKLSGVYNENKVQNAANKEKTMMIGASAPMGAGALNAAYSTAKIGSAKQSKFALGYVHNLSKRTAVYTTLANVKAAGGATVSVNGVTSAVNGSGNGLDVGLRHAF